MRLSKQLLAYEASNFPGSVAGGGSGWLGVRGTDAAAQAPPVATNAPNISETSTPATNKPVQLSYGVADVLKLSQAQVGEDVILAYIANSGRTYNLSATEIVYLRGQGVSDGVLSAMLNQRNQMTAAQAAAAQAQAVPASQAATGYGVVEETTAAPSTVYVVPDSSYSYYYTEPYWGYGPGVSFGIGIPIGPGPRPAPPRVGPGPGRGLGRVQWS